MCVYNASMQRSHPFLHKSDANMYVLYVAIVMLVVIESGLKLGDLSGHNLTKNCFSTNKCKYYTAMHY